MSITRFYSNSQRLAVIQHDSEPSLTFPVSQACTQSQMEEPAYIYWCSRILEAPKTHRKQWEFCYILQALSRSGAISPGLRGLGFGVGEEPLTALFAAYGVEVMATDLELDRAQHLGWATTDQHAQSKEILNSRGICDAEAFERLVTFRNVDMNAIDGDLIDFDFCWSACALEHLGSIELGLRFVENSLRCLKPGGVAVHTTELNCSSDQSTIDNAETVLFRKCDLIELTRRLKNAGHRVELNFSLGDRPLDQHIDIAPYSPAQHLKLELSGYVTTSFGLIVRKL